MKINSTKKSLLRGVAYGVLTFAVYIAFTCLLYYYLNGENFINKDKTVEMINGVSFIGVEIAGVVISSLIPIFLIRYKSVDYYITSVFVAILIYSFLFITYFVLKSAMPLSLVQNSPLNSFDAIYYGIVIFPFGALIGLLITPIINFVINAIHKRSGMSK